MKLVSQRSQILPFDLSATREWLPTAICDLKMKERKRIGKKKSRLEEKEKRHKAKE
jgi:hypothetical protein